MLAPHVVGIDPVKSLYSRYSLVMVGAKVVGKGPERLFPLNQPNWRFVSSAILVGIEPTSQLIDKPTSLRFVNSANSDGMVPIRVLSPSCRYLKFGMVPPQELGMVPTR